MSNRRRPALSLGLSLLAASTLLLSGCGRSDSGGTPATADSAVPAAATATDPAATPPRECQGEPVQYAVGSRYTPELGEKIRGQSGSTVVRVLHPGEVVTMEFRVDRVSITVDEKDVITQVTSG
jgi:hypothetical protein